MNQKDGNNKIQKPPTMIINETRKAIIDIINQSGLPIYIIEPMMKELAIECSKELEFLCVKEMNQYHDLLNQQDNDNKKYSVK